VVRRRTLAVGAGVTAVGTGVVWETARRRDLAALRVDPHRDVLTAVPPGRPTSLATDDGTVLHVRVHTPPRPRAAVILAHGWAMSLTFWIHQLRDLARDHQLIAYDQRGHGGSSTVGTAGFDIDALGGDVAAVVDRFVDPRLPLIAVGHSLGGMSLLAAARREQLRDRVDGAVLVGTGAGELTEGMFRGLGVLEQVASNLGARVLRARLPAPARTTPVSSRIVRAVSLSPTAPPSAVALTEQLFLDTPVDARANLGITLADLDLSDHLPHWTVPSTVVVGTRDRMTPRHHAQRLVRELPDAHLVEVPGAGHQSPLEQPERVTGAIRDRIDATVASSAA
jgi:pimeloyl-ACP methyl ester carboxylesterase